MGFWDGSGISWTMCKQSAPCSRQITTPTTHHSIITLHTHTHPFNGPLSRTTRVSRYQKGRTNLVPVPHHSIFYRPDALPVARPTIITLKDIIRVIHKRKVVTFFLPHGVLWTMIIINSLHPIFGGRRRYSPWWPGQLPTTNKYCSWWSADVWTLVTDDYSRDTAVVAMVT